MAESLLIVSPPVTGPAVVGVNVTCRVTLCFGSSVSGKFAPETLNPAPVMVAALIVTVAVPVEVSVSGCVEDEPAVTSPKLRLAALSDNCGLGAGVPVPLRVTAAREFVAELLLMVIVPDEPPVWVGSNVNCTVTACCGFRVSGKVAPDTLKPGPTTGAE